MRIVISHLNLDVYGGTESYLLTVARQLERLGNEPIIYARDTGPAAEFIRSLGMRVESRTAALPETCDLVLAQDASTAYELAARFPDALRIETVHSRFPYDFPPGVPGVYHGLVVLNDRLRVRTERVAPGATILRLRQPIDLSRFGAPETALPGHRILLLGNYPNTRREQMIAEVCDEAGFELHRVGAHSANTTPRPESEIRRAEIVITLGRGALEAMAAARAVYVLGPVGGDGWVTPESYPGLERDGFSGRATETLVGRAQFTADLQCFRADMGGVNRDLIWAHHDDEDHVRELLAFADRLSASPPPAGADLDDLAHLIRMERYEAAQARHARAETEELRTALTELRAHAQATDRAFAAMDARLAAVLSSRRYRTASAVARLAARARGRRGL